MKRKTILLLLALVLLLLSVHGALAMGSTNYLLVWFTPLTTGGGGPISSTNYAADVTLGQSVIGASTSTNYSLGLGYWAGLQPTMQYLPLVIRK